MSTTDTSQDAMKVDGPTQGSKSATESILFSETQSPLELRKTTLEHNIKEAETDKQRAQKEMDIQQIMIDNENTSPERLKRAQTIQDDARKEKMLAQTTLLDFRKRYDDLLISLVQDGNPNNTKTGKIHTLTHIDSVNSIAILNHTCAHSTDDYIMICLIR
jgi:hypothetical protein